RHDVERMAQPYQLDRIERRSTAFPTQDLCLAVARQFGKLSAIHVGPGHRARQALANSLLLGDVILFEHRHASPVRSSLHRICWRTTKSPRLTGSARRGKDGLALDGPAT